MTSTYLLLKTLGSYGLIESSLVSGHFANKTNNAYLDIFSCKYHNPEKVAEFCKNFFQAKDVKLHYIFRK